MDLRFSQFEIITGAGTLILCLFFVCVFSEVSAIEDGIASAATKAVDSPDLYWSSVEVNGQSVVLTGTAPDVPARDAAVQRAWHVDGVVDVDNQIQVIGAAGDCQEALTDYALTQPVRFKAGKAEVADTSMHALGMIAMIVRSCRTMVEVATHTDDEGDEEINLRLSQRRAEVVAKHLVRHGVAPERLRAVGYGETQPVAENDTEEGRDLNRRVEFRVVGETA